MPEPTLIMVTRQGPTGVLEAEPAFVSLDPGGTVAIDLHSGDTLYADAHDLLEAIGLGAAAAAVMLGKAA